MTMLSRDEAQALLKKVLALSKAEACVVNLNGNSTGNIRYARNSVSTAASSDNMVLAVQSSFGKRSGTATINEFDEASLENAVRRSEELARLAPENPEFMPPLGPQHYLAPAAGPTTPPRSRRISAPRRRPPSIEPAAAQQIVAAGYLEDAPGFAALANSKGCSATTPRPTSTSRSPCGPRTAPVRAGPGLDQNDVTKLDPVARAGSRSTRRSARVRHGRSNPANTP